jgi:spectinomycin phosphotransferase
VLAPLPPALTSRIPSETFSPVWREQVRDFQRQIEARTFDESIAAKMAAFLKSKRDEINWLVGRAEQLAAILQVQWQTQPPEFVLCHADIHVGNLLIDSNDKLYIVDWDTVMLAPKERDLMFVGGGQFVNLRSPEEEERLFYQGYGQTETNAVALAYYRYERIVQDIAAYCEEILLAEASGDDQENGLRQLTSQFRPHDVIEIASRSEKFLPEQYKAR